MKNLGAVAHALILAFEWRREEHQKFKGDPGDPSTKYSVSHLGTKAIPRSTERPCLRKTNHNPKHYYYSRLMVCYLDGRHYLTFFFPLPFAFWAS